MSTKADELDRLALGKGPLGRASNDEPLFILRAADKLAPEIVTQWATAAATVGSPPEKVREALGLAQRMRDWQRRNPSKVKVPD